MEEKTITKHWVNYFSFGIDGKIGYSFDLHRTSSRLGNLAMYSLMGFVKSFTKTKTLGQLVSSFSEEDSRIKATQEEEIRAKNTEEKREANNEEI